MKSYDNEVRSEDTLRWAFIQCACWSVPLVSVIIFFIIFRAEISMPEMHDFMFGVSLCAIAAILAGTYYYTYRYFDEDKFYFFIFLSWVANAIYLIPELVKPASVSPSHHTGVFFLSLISSCFLLLAFCFRGEKVPDRRRLKIGAVIGIFLLSLDILIIYKNKTLLPADKTQAYLILAGSFFAFLFLWAIAEVLTAHLSSITYKRNFKPLRYTFYFYGLLQFSYPFKPFMDFQTLPWLPAIFVAAQLAKVVNAISIMGVLQAVIAYRDLKREDAAREAAREAEEAVNKLRFRELELEAQASRLEADQEKLQRESQYVQLGMLASSIKHDVNTPLATMSFDIGSLKDKFQSDNSVLTKLENLEESMRRIYAIVKVVDIFRGDKAFYNRDKFMSKASMLEIAHRAVRSVKNEKEELKQSNARTRIKVTGRDVWVRANVPMLEQVVVNVIKNGLEAIDEAKRERGLIEINVGTTKLNDSQYPRLVRVVVADNGCGIPEENIEKLTTLFTTRSDKKPNSGIGLFIGKKILDIHDGDIKFESEVGEWTRTTLLLPEWRALQKQNAGVPSAESATDGGDKAPDTENTLNVEPESSKMTPTAPVEASATSGGIL